MPVIYVDADACPVKEEVYDVALRYGVSVVLVANSPLRVPREVAAELVVVGQGLDAADDWIAAHAGSGDVVVTADIPLAARCLTAGAAVLGTDGRPFREDSIGDALASREVGAQLRERGVATGGPRPLSDRERSRFASKLDEAVSRSLRKA